METLLITSAPTFQHLPPCGPRPPAGKALKLVASRRLCKIGDQISLEKFMVATATHITFLL